MYLIEMFGVSLLLTLIIEFAVAWLFRIPFGREWLPILLVNILTNPMAVLINWLITLYLPQMKTLWIQLPLECVVVVVEFLIYGSLSKSGWSCKRPFLLALVSNAASWLVGVVISL